MLSIKRALNVSGRCQSSTPSDTTTAFCQAAAEHTYAAIGCGACALSFFIYLGINYRKAMKPDGVAESKRIDQVRAYFKYT